MAYKACMALIAAGRIDGLAEKIERLAEAGRITATQRAELLEKIAEVTA